MLRPLLCPLELGPELRSRLEPPILDALFEHIKRYPPSRRVQRLPSLTVTQAKEILEIALPHYREYVAEALPEEARTGLTSFRETGDLVHKWLHESIRFFRREGAQALRKLLEEPDADKRSEELWEILFPRCLLSLVQSSGLLAQQEKLESCDLAVECLKLWSNDLTTKFGTLRPEHFSPAAFFLDTEADLEGTVQWKGSKIHLRGKPDAIILNAEKGRHEVCEYKFGLQGQLELQIAQILLYIHLINAAKGAAFETGRLELFRVIEDIEEAEVVTPRQSEFPSGVDAAFAGYIGNQAAVRRLKIQCSLALKSKPPKMSVNLMLCGAGGLGKTELARRVAKALSSPFVDVPANILKSVDDLVGRIDAALNNCGQVPVEEGNDSGLPRLKYPPLVVFIDEVHELSKRADVFLNMFEPKEKRAVTKHFIGDFKDATILAATTDMGLLPGTFLTRFRIVDLEPYTAEEVADIIRAVFEGSRVSDDFLIGLAQRGRLNPRVCLERAKEMLDHHRFNANRYPLTLEGLERMSSEVWKVDEHGLRQHDLDYLRALQSGPKGLSALTSLLPVQKEEIQRIIEPYLLQLSAIRQTGKGRELTERGRLLGEGHS